MVPALRAKFTPLGDASVEEAEREEHGVELLLPGALIQSVLEQKKKEDGSKRKHET